MLKTKSVAKLIQDTLNKQSTEEQFRVVYEYGSYKGTEINAIIKQGKGTITPIMNYTTSTNPFFIEFVVPTRCGEDRIDGIVEIINGMIDELNGKINPVGNGRGMFAFNPLEIGGLETRATAGQSVLMKLEFNIEYSETSGKADEVVYEMALINSPFFEADEINTRYFEDENTQQDWYLNKIKNGGIDFTKTFTPINESSIIQQIIYINENGFNNDDIITKNCAIIRQTKNGVSDKYFYYRVESASINIFNQVVFDLKMDTLQTYYFDNNIEIPDCLINRAHLKRWWVERTSNGLFRFDFSSNSKLLTSEDVSAVSKRAVSRYRLNPVIDTSGASEVNNWFNENVSHWVYYYITGGKSYHFRHAVSAYGYEDPLNNIAYVNGNINDVGKTTTIDGGMVVLVAPVYKKDKRIKISYVKYEDTTNTTAGADIWNEKSLLDFLHYKEKVGDPENPEQTILRDQGGYSNVYAKKYSIMPPFFAYDFYGHFIVNGNGDLVYDIKSDGGINETNKKTGYRTILNCVEFLKAYYSDGCFGRVIYQNLSDNITFKHNGEYLYRGLYSKDDIKNTTSPIEPKLLNEEYSIYRINMGGNFYDLPISKTSMEPSFIYKEVLTPDITKSMLIYDAKNSKYSSDIFADIQTKDFTGFFINSDFSMWFETNNLRDYLVNNKNYLQILNKTQDFQETEMSDEILRKLGSNILQMATTSENAQQLGLQIAQEGLNKMGDVMKMSRKFNFDKSIRSLTLDNMRQSPQKLSALNSNVLLMGSVDDFGIYIEVQKPLPSEQKRITDKLNMYGYAVNMLDNVRNCDSIRKVFNYVEASVESIIGDISNEVKTDIKRRFFDGVRFWRVDDIKYDNIANYEEYIDNVEV